MLAGPFAVLRVKEFSLVLLSILLSHVGTWMQIAALGIFAVEETGKAQWVAALSTISYLSLGLLSPLGGTIADRFDRRLVIAIAVSIQAVLSVVLAGAFIAGIRSPLLTLILAGLQGALIAFDLPALAALVPDIVTTDQLAQASSLIAASWNIGRAIGPVLAVAAINVASYQIVFLANAVSFLGIAVAMMLISKRPLEHHEDGTTWRRLQSGIKSIRHEPQTRRPLLASTAEMILAAPFIALIPAMAQLTLNGNASDTGNLFTAQGLGSALGVMLITGLFIPRFGQERVFAMSLIATCLCGVLYATSPTIAIAILLIIPLSASHTSVISGSTVLIQHNTAAGIRGTVLAIYIAITNCSYAISSVVVAWMSDHFGLRAVLNGGFITLLLLLLVTRLFQSRPAVPPAHSETSAIRTVHEDTSMSSAPPFRPK